MELKAFKGMPHEFGGIDYTEGSEVEGGEFAVQIGKSGNEYIFDKNSSEGERLSKEYKRLDKNGRLTEDDPLALEAFDQMAREEALKHAQRSVNEKGVDPFRNMYDQGGQAANGGVKYAAGGAKDMYFTGGVAGGFNTSLLTDIMGGADGILGMTDLMGSMQGERGGETTQSPMDFAGMFKSQEAQQDVAEAQQKIDANAMSNSGGLVSGIGNTLENLIKSTNNAGDVEQQSFYRSSPDDKKLSQGTKYVQPNQADTAGAVIGGAATGFEQGMQFGPIGGAIGAVIGGVTKPLMEKKKAKEQQDAADEQFKSNLAFSRNEELEKQVQGNVYQNVDSGRATDYYPYLFSKEGGALPKNKKPIYGYYANGGGKKANAYEDYLTAREKELAFKTATEGPYGINYSDVMYGPSNIEGRTDMRTEINNGNVNQSFNQVSENRNIGASSLSPGFDVRMETDALNGQANQKFFTRNNATGDVATTINGTTQFQNGGGKKKEDEVGDYGTVTNESTCVKGVNCFEDLAEVQGIPDSIYNNRAMREFFQSEEGKKLFEKTDNPQPGDLVQFNKANPAAAFKNLIKFYTSGNSNPSDLKYFEYLFDYPFHTGVIKDDKNYIGDGSSYEPVHSGLFDFSNLFTPSNDYYRYKDPESAKKVLEAAKQMEKNKTDILRKTFGDEKPVKYRNPEKYSSLYPYPSSTL